MTMLALGRAGPAVAAPIDMADLFLVDQDGNWFCDDTGDRPVLNTTCGLGGRTPAQAAQGLLGGLQGPHGNLYLRVAKARDDCDFGQPGRCMTGVPAYAPCATSPDSPWCTLDLLRGRGIKLGVVLGAGDDGGKPRSVANLAHHACEISRADTERLYDFMFLDLTKGLKPKRLAAAIRRIRAGRTGSGKPCPGVSGARKRWSKLVVNENHTWDPKDPGSLRTGAWAHAKRLEVLGKSEIKDVGGSDAAALTPEDRQFVRQVNALAGPSRAVLRLEVPKQSGRFAGLPTDDQCSLLTRWARLQHEQRFTLIFPVFVHGVGDLEAYDSFGEQTFGLQSALIDRYPSAKGTKGLPACGPGGGDDTSGKDREPAGKQPPDKRPPQPPPPPVVRPAGAGAQEPTEVTCRSARLHGWVNPHGNAARFRFEYWEHGVNVVQTAGGGDAGAGTERNDVSRVAEGLRPDTGYSARLIAVNAAGESPSEIVSFKTRKRC